MSNFKIYNNLISNNSDYLNSAGALLFLDSTVLTKELELESPGFVFIAHTDTTESVTSEKNPISHALNTFCAKLKKFPEVKYIVASIEDVEKHKIIRIWTIILCLNREVQTEIYKIQLETMRKFPEHYYDFNIIFLDNKRLSDFVSNNADVIFHRE